MNIAIVFYMMSDYEFICIEEEIMFNIRYATILDLNEITAIYNEAIEKTNATFDTEIKTKKDMKMWFESHSPKNPILVAVNVGVIVGWASLSQWSDRCAYSDTAEISVYIKEKYQNKGFGKQLIKEIVQAGKKAGLHVLVARITEGNEQSIHLHELEGFFCIGVMKEVGFKFNRRLDVLLMQKIYSE